MNGETPGKRIRAKRVQLSITQAELARFADLNERAINQIEVGTMSIVMIGPERLQVIATKLRTTAEYILHGELQSERPTREELQSMRKEGVIRNDEELKRSGWACRGVTSPAQQHQHPSESSGDHDTA